MRLCFLAATALAVSLLSVTPARAQEAPGSYAGVGCRPVDENKRPLYIRYESVGPGPSDFAGKSETVVRLRLHNNLTCGIVVPTATYIEINPADGKPTLPPGSNSLAPLFYRVQDYRRTKAPRAVPEIHATDLVFSALIPPGRSLEFGVPLHYFKKQMHVVVSFHYVWEGMREQTLSHQLYFLRDMLPEQAWEKVKR